MTSNRLCRCALGLSIGVACVLGALPAKAQIASLDKGHQLLVIDGLQVWGTDTDTTYSFTYSNLTGANMNGVMWGFPAANGGSNMAVLATGNKWGREIDYSSTPSTVLSVSENSHKLDLVALQVGDEQDLGTVGGSAYNSTVSWFQNAQSGNTFPNQLLYVNQFFFGSGFGNFVAAANPDAISFDSYPFANPDGHYITPNNWLGLSQITRRYALGSYIGATGISPRPYGAFLQTYHDSFAVDPGEVEMRWQQFALLTMGFTFMDAFIYDGGNTNFGTVPGGTLYNQFKESAQQSRNLGPELVKLISYSNGVAGGGTSIVVGKNSSGTTNSVPNSWQAFSQNHAPPNQRYLTSVTNVTNMGTKNGGQPGDVYIGFFNPLLAAYGDPSGEAYFMVTNGLGGYLTLPSGSSDNTALVTDCLQSITLHFSIPTATGITALERINRNTGLDELIPLTFDGTSGSNRLYHYTYTEDGGTGDLFKYADGSPFVGSPNQVPEPTALTILGMGAFALLRRRR